MLFRIFLLIAIFSLPKFSLAASEIQCNRVNGNQLELNACAKDEFEKVDKELNALYQALIRLDSF